MGEVTGEKHVVEAKGDNVLETDMNARSQAQGPRPKVGRLPKAQSEVKKAAMKQNVMQTSPEDSTELRRSDRLRAKTLTSGGAGKV